MVLQLKRYDVFVKHQYLWFVSTRFSDVNAIVFAGYVRALKKGKGSSQLRKSEVLHLSFKCSKDTNVVNMLSEFFGFRNEDFVHSLKGLSILSTDRLTSKEGFFFIDGNRKAKIVVMDINF